MREIKFRGKRLDNGEWEYGDLVHTTNDVLILPTDKGWEQYKVDPETVGQYIGIKDRDGKEIWEGDIVMVGSRDEEYDEIVKGFPFLIMFNYVGFCIAEDDMSPWGLISNLDWLEVIGNIHDNPELLKGE